MNEQEKILGMLDIIENKLQAIRNVLEKSEEKSEKKLEVKDPKFYANSLPANELGPLPNIYDNNWPQAVDPKMIVSQDEEMKQFRALQVMSLINTQFDNKTVLDCGCGEGHVANEISHITKVVGYDKKENKNWPKLTNNNLIFTIDKQIVTDNSPYDIIVLYDVLDHIESEDPEKLMKWLNNLLSKDGIIFVRTHPWVGRTGGHYYESINKAYVHLAITPDEAAKEGIKQKEPNLKIVRPMAAYEAWFKDAGLVIIDKKVKTVEVDDFFTDEIIDRMIKINWGKIDIITAKKIMANHFIDYTLKK